MSFIKDTFFGGSEKKAARGQVEAGREAIASNERALEIARGDLQPFRDAGGAVLDPLTKFVSDGPETELTRTEGFDQIQNSAAARGKLNSGGTLEELTSFNNRLNESNRSQRFNELFNVASLGANAASGQATGTLGTAASNASTLVGIGDANAAGLVGSANSKRSTLGGIASFLGLAG